MLFLLALMFIVPNSLEMECYSRDLIEFGCQMTIKKFYYNNECEYGHHELECDLNFYPDVILLKKILEHIQITRQCCWNRLVFNDIYQIPSFVFDFIEFKAKNVKIIFNNPIRIESQAFDNTKNISVELNFENYSDELTLYTDSFTNMNLNEFKIGNYLNVKLVLDGILFIQSNINSFRIENSYFSGFLMQEIAIQPNLMPKINRLFIENCFFDTLNRTYLGNFIISELNIKSSNLILVENETFLDVGMTLVGLDLSDNRIEKILSNSFRYLTNLKNLNLDSNPLVTIEYGSFDDISKSLTKLSIQSTRLHNFTKFYRNMSNLIEIDISNNPNIDTRDVFHIINESSKLKYLDLSYSEHVFSDGLESLLESMNDNISHSSNFTFLSVKSHIRYLRDQIFYQKYSLYGSCYLENLLKKTFIQLDNNHPCNCYLTYLYRNLNFYTFPRGKNSNYPEEYLTYEQASQNLTFISSFFPKCFREYFLDETFLIRKQISCNLTTINSNNCTEPIQTTLKSTSATVSTLTSKLNQSTSTIVTNNQMEETTKKLTRKNLKIDTMYAIIGALALLVSIVLSIGIILTRQNYKYKKQYSKMLNRPNRVRTSTKIELSSIRNKSFVKNRDFIMDDVVKY